METKIEVLLNQDISGGRENNEGKGVGSTAYARIADRSADAQEKGMREVL